MDPINVDAANFFRALIERLGGPHRASYLCNVSRQSIHNWCLRGRVHEARGAIGLHRACVDAGVKLTLEQLVGLEALPSISKLRKPREPKSTAAA
jgi:hypothetical protein